MAITKVSPGLLDLDSGITITTADNTSQLILTSTDADSSAGPVLELFRNSGSPADNDATGLIYFYGENDNDEKIAYGQIYTQVKDASDGTEDGSISFYTMKAGTSTETLNLTSGNVGIGVAAHATAGLNITNTSQHIRLNNGSELAAISLDTNGILDIWAHGDGETMTFRTGTGSGSVAMTIEGTTGVGIGINPENAYTSYTALEISRSGSIYANNSADDLNIGTNFYLESGGNWRAKNTETASLMQFDNGAFNFYTSASTTADNNISWNHKIAFPNAGGIAFNGDTAQANALDDYEEGTWTPDISGSSSTSGVGYAVRDGHYTKIGNMVTANFSITFNDKGSMSGTTRITGLPFSGNNSPQQQSCSMQTANMNVDKDQTVVAIQYAVNALAYLYVQESGLALSQISGNSQYTDTSQFIGSLTYFTDS